MGTLYIFIACFFWALNPIITRYLIHNDKIDPETLTFLRFLIATFFLYIWTKLSNQLKAKKLNFSRTRNIYLIIAGIALSVNLIFYNIGLKYTTASFAVLLERFSIIVMIILSYFVFKEKLNLSKSIGFILTIIGVVLVTTQGQNLKSIFSSIYFLGNILILLAGVTWGIYAVFQKISISKHNIIESMVPILFTGMLFSGIYLCFNLSRILLSIDVLTIILILFLGIGPTAMAYSLFAKGSKIIKMNSIAIFLSFTMVISLILSNLLLNESISKITIIGAIFIIISIIITDWTIRYTYK